MENLDTLVQEAYKLFSPYKIQGELAFCVCPICVSEEDVPTLYITPLKELPRQLIHDILSNVDHTNPNLINQIRYLLPRILELMVQKEYLRHSTELILDSLHCQNTLWLKNETDFLERFSEAYLVHLMSSQIEKGFDEFFDSWLSDNLLMFALAEMDCDKLLTVVENHLDNWHIIKGLVYIITFDLENGIYYNFFDNKSFGIALDKWFKQPKIIEKINTSLLESIEANNVDDITEYYVNNAFDFLNSLKMEN